MYSKLGIEMVYFLLIYIHGGITLLEFIDQLPNNGVCNLDLLSTFMIDSLIEAYSTNVRDQ